MEATSLDSLPDDLILDVIQQLNTARDVAHLGASTRRMRSLAQHAGWKSFVKSRFPATDDSLAVVRAWHGVADRLTYLDRCWDKRGFFINMFAERQQNHPQRRGRPKGQSVPFHPVLDAHLVATDQTELVAWGVGEDLLLRRTEGKSGDVWQRIHGNSYGYVAGTGDVTAVSIVERNSTPEVTVGRANGDIHVLSATGESCGQVIRTLSAPDATVDETGPIGKKSPGQLAVTWTEWNPQTNMLAGCRSSMLTLYDLNDDDEPELSPTTFADVAELSAPGETSLLRNVKFMGNGIIACALGGSSQPLRFYKLLPTGLEPLKSGLLTNSTKLDGANEKTTVRAIEPVGHPSSQNLLLSAWDDGTYRLNDIRSPSDKVSVYRDRFQPFQGGSSLLVYGTNRFVSGSNFGPDLRFFDFRFPKSYHHTDALPCSGSPPWPRVVRQYDDGVMGNGSLKADKCDHLRDITCNWHSQSKRDEWRPDAVLHVGNSYMYDRVYSLAKASDLSSSFYCGLRGTVMEMNLTLAEHVTPKSVERAVPPGWQVEHVTLPSWEAERPRPKVSLQEPGIGLEKEYESGNMDEGGVPPLWYYTQYLGNDASSLGASQRRLDETWTGLASKS